MTKPSKDSVKKTKEVKDFEKEYKQILIDAPVKTNLLIKSGLLMIFLIGVFMFLTKKFNFIVSEYLADYRTFLVIILIYYIYVSIVNRHTEGIFKTVIFNFLGIIGLYNILILFNPFRMTQLSNDYWISNILYFYISFLFVSFDFKIYEKLSFITGCCFSLMKISTKNVLKVIFVFLIYASLWGYFVASIWVLSFMSDKPITPNVFYMPEALLIIPLLLTIATYLIVGAGFFFYIKDDKEKSLYFLMSTQWAGRLEKTINTKIEWLINILKIERIKSPPLLKNKKKIDYINMTIFMYVKIIIFHFICLLYTTDLIFFTYKQPNNGYCQDAGFKDDTAIIKLSNNNVFVVDGKSLQEKKCEQKLERIDIKIANYR